MRIAGYWGDDETGAANGIVLHSCGHNRLMGGEGIYRPCGGQTHLLLYIHKEYECFQFGGTHGKALPGAVVLYKPGEMQRHSYDGGQTAENYYVHFSLPDSDLLQACDIASSCIHPLPPSGQAVEGFETMIRELQMKPPHYQRVATAAFIALVCGIDRRLRQQRGTARAGEIQAVSPAINCIHEKYDQELSLEALAGLCGLSKYHFARLFKQATGQAPIAYRNALRIRHAQSLLEESDRPVGEVAALVGCSDPAYFSSVFTAAVGLSPRAYRKTHG